MDAPAAGVYPYSPEPCGIVILARAPLKSGGSTLLLSESGIFPSEGNFQHDAHLLYWSARSGVASGVSGQRKPECGLLSESSIGNSDDIKWLLAEQIPHLRRYARALTGDVHQAGDLVQDALETALKKRRLLRQKSSVRAWVFKIMYRRFLARKRRKSRIVDAEVRDDAVIEPAGQLRRLHCLDVLSALDALPDDQRAAVTLVALEDVSYDSAAEILGVPVGTLRSRVSRGRATLRAAAGAVSDEANQRAEALDEKPRLRSVK